MSIGNPSTGQDGSESFLGRIIQAVAAPLHKKLHADIQAIVETGKVRMVGFDEEGSFLGTQKLMQDLRTVLTIEQDLVIDPQDIKKQIETLQGLFDTKKSFTSEDLQKASSFAALGGHASLNTIPILLDVLEKHGYVCLLEYDASGQTIPGGYMYGFSESFEHDDRFPTLGLDSLSNPLERKKCLIEKREKIITNWRTGVPLKFQHLANRGIDIPQDLQDEGADEHKKSPRHWGGGNALKLAVAAMGHAQGKEILMLNVGAIEPPDELLGGDLLHNVASSLYNGAFLRKSNYPRSVMNEVTTTGPLGMTEKIGSIRWDIFHNLIPDAILQLSADGGVLQAKGGWQIEKIIAAGKSLASIRHEDVQEKVQQARRELASNHSPLIVRPSPQEE